MALGGWTALALPSVRRSLVEAALHEVGADWGTVSHVTATTTLASTIRRRGQVGLPLASLIDLVVMPSLSGGMALPLDGFPGPDVLDGGPGERRYRAALGSWQAEASGRRLLTGVRFDDSLRGFVRDEAPGRVGRALLASRRALATTVHTLVAAGVEPEGLRPTDEVGAAAARAWARAEQEISWLGDPRRNIWLDHDDVEQGSTSSARDLVDSISTALDTAFGAVEGRRTVVHHGFYFYTPPQWAMFQLLRRVPGVDQVFVVHDDGLNPAFSSWRHYFRSDLGMPVPQRVAATPETEASPPAAALRSALQGRSTSVPDGLRVVDCRTPADLVRMWADRSADVEDADTDRPAHYAAAAEQVERYVQRLGRREGSRAPSLAQLPVGSFLLALHRCIVRRDGGAPGVRLGRNALLDVVSSGCLDVAQGDAVQPALLRRVLPYFADCSSGEEWVARAGLLVATVRDRVAPLGAREPDVGDLARIEAAAGNLARLVPWADVTVTEAQAVHATVERVVGLVEQIGSRERVRLGDHLHLVHAQLRTALASLPDEERRVVEGKLHGFGALDDEEIDVDGLVDVVAMLVGRTADLDPAHQTGEQPDSTAVAQLRGLDALGMEPLDHDLHVANLAEDAFPTSGRVVGWPFTLDDLRAGGDDAADPVAVDLLSTRASTATLGDLYLFWLALDGVAPGRGVTLSWISQTDGDRRRLSPVVALLARPDHWSRVVGDVAGGVVVDQAQGPADLPAATAWLPPTDHQVDDDDVEDAIDSVDARAVASAAACPRRFAVQWALGPSAAFGAEHLQGMLYGNVVNGLQQAKALPTSLAAMAVARTVWPHLTEGQLESSLQRARVGPSGGSKPEWALTLAGAKNKSGLLDKAYEVARERVPPDSSVVAPPGATYLPLGVPQDDADVCSKCPVQARCSQWRDPRAGRA